MLTIYQFLSIILAPFVNLYLIYRKFQKKEDPSRINERLGNPRVERPQGFLLWIHCASVGEANSALTLINSIGNKYPHINILITSGTVTSALQLEKNLPQKTIHQYIPVDKFFAAKNFIKHWKPDLAIFVESELWPNLITQTKKSGCKLVLMNGRISDGSYKRWKILHKIGFNILKEFSLCFAQSKSDQDKFIDLGIKNTVFLGNLKSASKPLLVCNESVGYLKERIGSRPFWVASSTHKGEEEIIIRTHENLKRHFPNILTIIVPRHPNRLKEIITLIPDNIKVSIRSQNQEIDHNCQIYLADTIGELGIFYSLSNISLICGSLIDDIGGHNPFEALQLGAAVLSGHFVCNFQEVYSDLQDSNTCIVVNDESELLSSLIKLLKDEGYLSSLLKNTSIYSCHNNEMIDNIMVYLDCYIS
jgi:3-deoxy-D-manno-octulosonic-acid transferase